MDPYDLLKSAEGILHILMVNVRKNEDNSSERMKQMQYFRQLEECSYYDSFYKVFRQLLIELTSAGEQDLIKAEILFFRYFRVCELAYRGGYDFKKSGGGISCKLQLSVTNV